MARAELCGTAAEGKKSQLSTNFLPSAHEKVQVHEGPKRCLVLYYKFIASEYCETLQVALNSLR